MRLYAWKEYNPIDSVQLGCAIGTFFGKDRVIGVGRDGKPVCRFVRREIISGLASTGITAFDVRLVPSVALRHVIREQGIDAGVYVSFYDGEIQVHLYDNSGENVQPEVIDQILGIKRAGKFTRVGIEELGVTTYYPNAMEDFLKSMHERISFRKEMKLLVDCQGDPVAFIVEPLLKKYGIEPTLMNEFISGYGKNPPEEVFLETFHKENFSYGLRIDRDDTRGMHIYTRSQKLHTNNWLETLALLRDL
ncbi:MAG: hypothetical protein N3F63_04145 [Thermoplasmata archaeon]|nr:hypothetical protein [Thermoplasmata archaeon]